MIELLTTKEMTEADRLTIAAGTPGIELMDRAGSAVADAIAAAHSAASKVVVLVGPGNNGGDGFVAAQVLRDRGYVVRILLVGDFAKLKGDAALAAARWESQVDAASPEGLAGADVAIDALFGAGLDRPVEGLALRMIEAANECGIPAIAVDLPSGVNGTSGAVMGAAVRATRTVTFFRRKPGHLLLPGRRFCGLVTVADIGIQASTLASIRPQTFANALALWAHTFPIPHVDGHKYSRGHAVVVSGAATSTGAARLAARGALRTGAGLVTIASPRDALAINATANLAIMVRQVDGPQELSAFLADRRRNTIIMGPGLGVGAETRDLVLTALSADRAVVLDADALTSFSDQPAVLFAAISGRGSSATVLTPHLGEFAKLFPPADGPAFKLEQARQAAARAGAFVVLKGPDTVIAAPDGRAVINDNAPPWLATAGAGDVLAGVIGGLLAQGMPGFEAAAAGVWLHGEAGNQIGPGLIAEDLPEAMPRIYRELFRQLKKHPAPGLTAEWD
jgi:ADP-dependent NAD(P)H-hydrate dehydratase / NAD(P)H-hydrate epimerase